MSVIVASRSSSSPSADEVSKQLFAFEEPLKPFPRSSPLPSLALPAETNASCADHHEPKVGAVTAVSGAAHPRETAPNTVAHGTVWFSTSPRVVANITMHLCRIWAELLWHKFAPPNRLLEVSYRF